MGEDGKHLLCVTFLFPFFIYPVIIPFFGVSYSHSFYEQLGSQSSANASPEHRQDDRQHRDDDHLQRRRASAQQQQQQQAGLFPAQAGAGAGPVPPSPALVRHGSKTRRHPSALVPGKGGSQPASNAAVVGVPAATARRVSAVPPAAGHLYASATGVGPGPGPGEYGTTSGNGNGGAGGGYGTEEGTGVGTGAGAGAGGYSRAMPMTAGGTAPPALSAVHARGLDERNQDYNDNDVEKPSLIVRILTCRC